MVAGTAVNKADIAQKSALAHGQEEAVFGDAGYTGADERPELATPRVAEYCDPARRYQNLTTNEWCLSLACEIVIVGSRAPPRTRMAILFIIFKPKYYPQTLRDLVEPDERAFSLMRTAVKHPSPMVGPLSS